MEFSKALKQEIVDMKRHAFTLIELLVVIAIIAILAAILFPVFAQAKAAAKAVADLSNIKQTVTSNFIYTGDSDDLMPEQSGQDTTGVWGYNYGKYVPYNWSSAPNVNREAYSMNFYLNSLYPYTKNYDIYKSVGVSTIEDTRFTGQTPVYGIPKRATNTAFNGLLTSYSSTAINDPADLPLLTEQNGNVADDGGGFANPALSCATANAPCTYQSDASGSCAAGNGGTGAMYQTFGGGTASYWVEKEGQNWGFSDGHAKYRALGQTVKPGATNYQVDPMTSYDTSGHAGYYWYDGCFPWLFRPDYAFNE